MTLEHLQSNAPFASWDGHVDDKVLSASTLIYKSTLSKLMQIGVGKPAAQYIPVLNAFIEEFNRLDAEYEFIETVEREDIAERLGEILDVLQLPGIEECDDLPVVRDW